MKGIYRVGTVLLFLGLGGVFLPHAVHAMPMQGMEENDLNIIHTVSGVLVMVLGLGMMVFAERKQKAS